MTSIAETTRTERRPSWVRSLFVAIALGLLAAETPTPWAVLWLAVPVLVALSTLVSWRFGAWGLVVPALAVGGALLAGEAGLLWAWWMPAAALSGVWTGFAEEGGRGTAGERAWRLAPVLALAAALPWMPAYPRLVARVEADLAGGDREIVTTMTQLGYQGERLAAFRHTVEDNAKIRRVALPHLLPTVLFLWIALLAGAGRTFAARVAAALRWPALTRTPLSAWRVPDGVLWTFLAGLAVCILASFGSALAPVAPSGWTLLLNAALGFGVQGIAVVVSLMFARGVPVAVVTLTLLFVFAVAMPVIILTAVALGLSDAWLDYRRLEPTADGGQP